MLRLRQARRGLLIRPPGLVRWPGGPAHRRREFHGGMAISGVTLDSKPLGNAANLNIIRGWASLPSRERGTWHAASRMRTEGGDRNGPSTIPVLWQYNARTMQVRCKYDASTMQVRCKFQVKCKYNARTSSVQCQCNASAVPGIKRASRVVGHSMRSCISLVTEIHNINN